MKFAEEIRSIAERYMMREGEERYEIANLPGRSDALTGIANTPDAALEVAGEAQEAKAGETVYAKGRKYDPDRDRALKPGEMRNEFENALSAKEWNEYYERLEGRGYNADLFSAGDRTYMSLNNRILLMEMQRNGEFAVVGVYRSRYGWYDIVNVEMLLEGWEEKEYGQERIDTWLETFAVNDGSTIFDRYDRLRRRFVRIDRKTNGAGRGIIGVSGGRDAHGTGIREDVVGQDQGERADDEAVEFSDIKTSFSLRTEDPPKKTIIAYKAFYAQDGKLSRSMATDRTRGEAVGRGKCGVRHGKAPEASGRRMPERREKDKQRPVRMQ